MNKLFTPRANYFVGHNDQAGFRASQVTTPSSDDLKEYRRACEDWPQDMPAPRCSACGLPAPECDHSDLVFAGLMGIS
ncbi:MAG: hypothetical protein ACRCXH_07905 [Shewanella sp.]